MAFPVLDILHELRNILRDDRIAIVQAPPGAGKSTVLPLELVKEPWLGDRKIIMLEPRRLATRSVAMRMASLLQCEIGDKVGYRIRFENRTSAATKIEVVTEGLLTRMVQHDSSLEEVGMVIFDEFHERSLHADLALALCLQVQQLIRPDLRILIMSATLDAEKITARLGKARVVTSLGKQFPVTIQYEPPDPNVHITSHCAKVIRKALSRNEGDLLVFLPGAGEIKRLEAELNKEASVGPVIYPLYGDLPFKLQNEAILPRPDGKRKIILATSIAETSLTIEGIGIVIDSGFARVPKFNPRSGLTRLETVRVSKDAADQRAGRAGRLGPGICFRLWSESIHSNLLQQRVPEILEADLSPMMLELLSWGARPEELTWITPPPTGSVNQAVDLLAKLGAVATGKITHDGKAMLRFPTHPRLAHMMIKASDADPGNGPALAADIAAILEERDPLSKDVGADLGLRVEALRRWRNKAAGNGDTSSLERIEKLAAVWRKHLRTEVNNNAVPDSLCGSILMQAFPERIARRVDKFHGRYKLANGRSARLPDNDPLVREPWLAVAEMDEGVGEGKVFLAAPLAEETLLENATTRHVVKWDDERNQVVALNERVVGDFVISTSSSTNISDGERVDAICGAIKTHGLNLLGWQEALETFQARVLSLRQWRPEEAWPDVTDQRLVDTVKTWLPPFLSDISRRSELSKLDGDSILRTILPWELASKLDKLAPLKLPVPTGSLIRIQYFPDGQAPIMEVRLQELFGMEQTPSVNEGRTKVLLHLLSPGYKPVQVTQDLASFWNTTYQEVRKELRLRYPRHSWPEDPWTAEPVRGPKRKKM
jgi:ATP-dependent helicase HrpB